MTSLKINRILPIYISIVPLKFGVDIQSQTKVRVRKLKNPIWLPGSHFELNPWLAGDQVNSVYLGQYHGCWCPGSLRCQDISSHDIDYIEYVGPRIRGSVLSTCVKSMWSNDINCKYMFMFPLKNLALKGLTLLKISRLLHIYISIVPLKFGVDI